MIMYIFNLLLDLKFMNILYFNNSINVNSNYKTNKCLKFI